MAIVSYWNGFSKYNGVKRKMIEKSMILATMGLIVSVTTIYTNGLIKKIISQDTLIAIKVIRLFYAVIVILIGILAYVI